MFSQNFTFNFQSSGRRVCLVTSVADTAHRRISLVFPDSAANASEPITVYRRAAGTLNWSLVAQNLAPGTGHWTDTAVVLGDVWEYQVRRQDTWSYKSVTYDATGYTLGTLAKDPVDYRGQMILLVAQDVADSLPGALHGLVKELTADGWRVLELQVPRANSWDSGDEVMAIRQQIQALYAQAPAADKPRALFILGHVPLPRCGSTDVVAPDDHDQNKGARGCDAYYADIDGVFTDTATYNPGGLATPLAINLPGDYKWDQDFFPSDIEMAFGRVDFADLTDLSLPEMTLIARYLDRLSDYRHVRSGFDMGEKSAFYFGYDNSNDGSYRSLPNISTPGQVFQNYSGPNHNSWVRNNGPFKVYMQNRLIPEMADWQAFGMDATVFASDQSYWGFGDVPQTGVYSRIRSLLGVESKCLIALWTTTGINIFHQACNGEPLGLAMKTIMNHNATNQYLEKPPQQYDEATWWNRTHFAFYGDPTLTLYQVAPPGGITLSDSAGSLLLTWVASPDTAVVGYLVYTSDAETGTYFRLSGGVVTGNRFVVGPSAPGTWYMVKAVKPFVSGCGLFYHTSIGQMIEGYTVLNLDLPGMSPGVRVYPNPNNGQISLESEVPMQSARVYDLAGREVAFFALENCLHTRLDLSALPEAVYIMRIQLGSGRQLVQKVAVRD